ncbi:hypothetical protein KSF_106370 [Reticulibacter mediterranei]|uniref:Uncharacterized protein n=1 Tax=Reticulibacter mediterranei TaxID=2778369 RepID=A0A8J3IRC9_9CHLR|nr:hypothetical protein [Reticulibacter mediterranei]GHP00590.1 hypothetical protein KSF_106370 [Reticulibacter mediterranei]
MDLPESLEAQLDAIKAALLRQLDEQIASGLLPKIMEIGSLSIEQGTISIGLIRGIDKVAEVHMDAHTYQITQLKLVKE